MYLENPGIYYEIYNSGKPVIFLNGIMMNTLSWNAHIEKFDKNLKIILYDARDEGKSAKLKEGYDIHIHTDDLKKLIDHLGEEKVNLVGLSYGGQIAQNFVLKYPEMVEKLVLVNTTDHIDNYLNSVGEVWKYASKTYEGDTFFDLALPFIYSRTFYNENFEWLSKRRDMFKDILTKDWFDAFIRLASSNNNWTVKDKISEIKSKTLLIAGDEDIITPLSEMQRMHKSIKNSELVVIENAGHGLFLEKIEEFCNIINKFF
jgi:pimeloyl-ACP methyl ester carboxylesterase